MYSDVVCPACGKPHTFRDPGPGHHPAGSRFDFTCPKTGAVASFRSLRPEPVILCPAGTIPALWVPE